MQKKWSIIIVPNTSEQGCNITVSARALKLGVIGLCLLMIAGFAFCAAAVREWRIGNIRRVIDLKNEIGERVLEFAALNQEFANHLLLEDKLRK